MAPSVLDVIRSRAARGRGPHADGAKLVLCIEGGAMRGVVSAGMVVGIEQLGLLHCFDAIYGSSAGAMNGAYLLAGQAALGTTIYYEDINNANFIDFLRPLHGRPIVDLDYLVDDVMVRRKPLDTARILDASIPLVAIATDADTADRRVFRSFTSGEDLRHAMRAGASMPLTAGPPYPFRDRRYFDALLTEPIPVATAEADGATHVVALLTRPGTVHRGSLSLAERLLIARPLGREFPKLRELYLDRANAYARSIESLQAGFGPRGQAKVLLITPMTPVVGKLERSRSALVGGAGRGLEAVVTALTSQNNRAIETISAFRDGQRVRMPESATQAAEVSDGIASR